MRRIVLVLLLLIASPANPTFLDHATVRVYGHIFCGREPANFPMKVLLRESDFLQDDTMDHQETQYIFSMTGTQWEHGDLEPYIEVQPDCSKFNTRSKLTCCDKVQYWIALSDEFSNKFENLNYSVQACRMAGETCHVIGGGYALPSIIRMWRFLFS